MLEVDAGVGGRIVMAMMVVVKVKVRVRGGRFLRNCRALSLQM